MVKPAAATLAPETLIASKSAGALVYPFAAVIGWEAARRALLLLAVDPRLKGVCLVARPGSGKSTLARGFGEVFTRAVQSDRDGKRPPADLSICDAPFVTVPLGATEDRLLGGLDIELTLATGQRSATTGLLGEANGGVLFVEELNLLEPALAAHLAGALDAGTVRIEREGLSESHPASFVLVGTCEPAEGEVTPLLGQRIGLFVESGPRLSVEQRAEMMVRAELFASDQSAFRGRFEEETAAIQAGIHRARALLRKVRVRRSQSRRLAGAALSLGVEGNLADLFAARAARASAALAGRTKVDEEDLIAAIQLVLVPRATRLPAAEETASTGRDADRDPRNQDTTKSDEGAGGSEPGNVEAGQASPNEELIIRAIDAWLPTGELWFSQAALKGPRRAAGRREAASSGTRGRYVQSVARASASRRIAIDATLRAAAPVQPLRRRARSGECVDDKKATAARSTRVIVKRADLRFKKLGHRTGALFIFAVDASGSMVANRMAQAKGALTRLLQQAYLHRDRVALISFRGEGAEVLLPPTRSVELAKRLVDAIPSGGATPLAAALVKAMTVARLARLREPSNAILVLFTDGRANAGLKSDWKAERGAREAAIREELNQIGVAIQIEGIKSVVIDTKSKFVSTGEGRALAEMLGGRYVYLPHADAASVFEAVTSATARMLMS